MARFHILQIDHVELFVPDGYEAAAWYGKALQADPKRASTYTYYANLLYHHLRMSKEIQLHMWTSVLEKVARLSGGRMTGGIEIRTRRVT